jgi:hypothetical protein
LSTPESSSTKLQELILYIARRSANDPWFGKVKLAKLLAFSDFHAFGQRGTPITGATYVKLPEGPVPSQFWDALGALAAAGRARVEEGEVHGYSQHRVVAIDDPAPVFDELDLSYVDETMHALTRFNAKELSDLAHRQFVGWQLADMYEPIPYRTHWISPLAPTANEIREAQALYDEAMQGS